MRLSNSARYDDYASSRPALCGPLFLVRVCRVEVHVFRDAAWRIRYLCALCALV
jgi:hypothetical protein